MKTILLLTMLVLTTTLFAAEQETPYQKMKPLHQQSAHVDITWEYTDNVQKRCDDLRIKDTGKPYGYAVQACSSWNTDNPDHHTCLIITRSAPDLWTIGHETKHCFDLDWHS